jgi:hypothetical protein
MSMPTPDPFPNVKDYAYVNDQAIAIKLYIAIKLQLNIAIKLLNKTPYNTITRTIINQQILYKATDYTIKYSTISEYKKTIDTHTQCYKRIEDLKFTEIHNKKYQTRVNNCT